MPCGSWITLPPSTTSDAPVMYDAPSDARNATAFATSSGVPGRPRGVWRPASSSAGSDEAVAIQPGATEFAVTPVRPYSSAIVRIIPSSPAFAVAYAVDPGAVTSGPVTDDTIT